MKPGVNFQLSDRKGEMGTFFEKLEDIIPQLRFFRTWNFHLVEFTKLCCDFRSQVRLSHVCQRRRATFCQSRHLARIFEKKQKYNQNIKQKYPIMVNKTLPQNHQNYIPNGTKVRAYINDWTMPFPKTPSSLAPNPAVERYCMAQKQHQVSYSINNCQRCTRNIEKVT